MSPNNYQKIQVLISICIALYLGEFNDIQSQLSHLKFQKARSWTVKWVWFREYVLPLMFPIHTSNPASDKMKAKLSFTRLMIQFVDEQSRPCCRKNTGLVTFAVPEN